VWGARDLFAVIAPRRVLPILSAADLGDPWVPLAAAEADPGDPMVADWLARAFDAAIPPEGERQFFMTKEFVVQRRIVTMAQDAGHVALARALADRMAEKAACIAGGGFDIDCINVAWALFAAGAEDARIVAHLDRADGGRTPRAFRRSRDRFAEAHDRQSADLRIRLGQINRACALLVPLSEPMWRNVIGGDLPPATIERLLACADPTLTAAQRMDLRAGIADQVLRRAYAPARAWAEAMMRGLAASAPPDGAQSARMWQRIHRFALTDGDAGAERSARLARAHAGFRALDGEALIHMARDLTDAEQGRLRPF
jgi:hypothetical protein